MPQRAGFRSSAEKRSNPNIMDNSWSNWNSPWGNTDRVNGQRAARHKSKSHVEQRTKSVGRAHKAATGKESRSGQTCRQEQRCSVRSEPGQRVRDMRHAFGIGRKEPNQTKQRTGILPGPMQGSYRSQRCLESEPDPETKGRAPCGQGSVARSEGAVQKWRVSFQLQPNITVEVQYSLQKPLVRLMSELNP